MQNRIKELRQKNGLTLKGLSQRIDMPSNTISQYENNRREPKLKTWQKLADFFGVSVPYLQGFKEYSNKIIPTIVREDHFNYKISKDISKEYVDQINKIIDKVFLLGKESIAGNKEAQKAFDEISKIVSSHNINLPLAGSINMSDVNQLGSKLKSSPSNLAGSINMNNVKRQLGSKLDLSDTNSFKPLSLTFGKNINSHIANKN